MFSRQSHAALHVSSRAPTATHRSLAGVLVVLALCGLSLAALADAQPPPAASCPPTPSPAQSLPATTLAPPPGAGTPAASGQVLACAGSRPIDGATFRHWLNVARKFEAKTPKRERMTREARVREVMEFLISSDWLLEEAQARGINVSGAATLRTYKRIRREEFPKRGEFSKFLRGSGQTVEDLLLRVRLNLISERIQKSVTAGKHGPRRKLQAIERFAAEFKSRWQAQTYCEPAYAVSDCGHVQAPL